MQYYKLTTQRGKVHYTFLKNVRYTFLKNIRYTFLMKRPLHILARLSTGRGRAFCASLLFFYLAPKLTLFTFILGAKIYFLFIYGIIQ
jgi:hypothetical protein